MQLANPRTRLIYLTATFWNILVINLKKYDLYILKQQLINNTIANKLRLHRAEYGLTRKDLSLKVEIPFGTIKSIEDKGIFPDKDISMKLATFFKLETKYFYDDIYEEEVDTADEIRRYRIENNMTYKELGKMLDLSDKTVEKWEKRQNNVSRKNYYKLLENGII